MRTNIVIDNELMKEALKLTGAKTKKDAVELGLRTLVRLKHHRNGLNTTGENSLDELLQPPSSVSAT